MKRRHKLLTKAIAKRLPAIGSTDDLPPVAVKIVVKYFCPYSNWTWYVTEGKQEEDGDWLFFGLVDGFAKEVGYFTLSELETACHSKLKALPLVERDLYYGDDHVLAEVKS